MKAKLAESPYHLLLGLGFSMSRYAGLQFAARPVRHSTRRNLVVLTGIPKSVCSLNTPHVQIRPILLLKRGERQQSWMWGGTFKGRLILDFKRLPSKPELHRLVSGIEATFTHLHRMHPENFSSYQFPREFLRNGTLREEALIAFERSMPHAYQAYGPHGFTNLLGTSVLVADSVLAWLFFLLPTVMSSNELFDACCFFQDCCREYAFVGDVITETLLRPDEIPAHERERLAVESMVLASFRCVEALVGEPGKGDNTKFRARLQSWGIDYDEPVGFPGEPERALGERLLWLHHLRDTTSAHGRRRRLSPVTYAEAMEAQHLADGVLHEAIWHSANERGRPEGSNEECAFLLDTVCPDFDNPRWALAPIPELNHERAVDVIRRPGGLARIRKYTGLAP